MYDEQHFTRDAAAVRFDEDADGITVDDGEAQFDWDAVETVTIDDPPHADGFDSKRFYKLPATVAKPIAQPYDFGSDSITWLKKPREELKKAAWSLDNAPWTMDHPDSGMVKSVDDVRGFWRNPRYIDSLDDLDADLHIPVGDEEAKEYVEENNDVSVGFYNRIARVDSYDGVVGGTDDDGVDIEGYQTDMLFDHVASVAVGRCPGSEGCGLDDMEHGHVETDSFKRDTVPTDKTEEAEVSVVGDSVDGTDSMQATTDQPSGIKEADGEWFAVGPDEHTKDSTDHPGDHMYPVGGCGDINDAWRLRSHGEDLEISQDTLEQRLIRAAEAQDCDSVPDTMEEMMDSSETTDCGCGGNAEADDRDDTTMEIEFDDLSTKAALAKVEEQHDGVAEHLDDLREYEDAAEEAQEAAEELDLDGVQDLADSVSVLKEQKEKLEEELDEARRPQMEEDAKAIAEATDRFGEDAEEVIENLDEEPETIADKRELVEDLTEGYDEQTANPSDDDGTEQRTTDVASGRYAHTPWDN